MLLMKGEVGVESVYGKGSTFWIKIPQKIVDYTPLGKIDVSRSNADDKNKEYKLPNANILVVDDVLVNATIFKGLLKPMEANVDIATSGAQCIEMVKSKDYDLIFLDHMMPQMDGVETLQKLKNMGVRKLPPVIALTANVVEGGKTTYGKWGFSDYLTKPIELQKLIKVLKEHIS